MRSAFTLTMEFGEVVKEHDYVALLRDRVSNRFYAEDPMTLDQLAFLLWSTPGARPSGQELRRFASGALGRGSGAP